ncbi:hypothetical protein HHL16_13500 [Pseudoflavitalea sp. G-6-1-2]|uniref:hypothetical protein n=1 Tax=Pseudoflavitalea sp. G-6-1-2 TaxID=2728841 RepID=UPI00146D7888|nr:hypothetical protein [Pseudoflavitalea sp. G-6-1-2]NML21899.1 hypothetical protein [Pseudoflavitalea sp. G-6-1-2]
MKRWLIICVTCMLALCANAARYDRAKQPPAAIPGYYTIGLSAPKKAFFAPVKSHSHHNRSETVHRDNCNRSVSQCRTNGNDNIISGHALPLALIPCTRSQHTCHELPAFTRTLSRLLLFPNHYFW